MDYGIHDRHVSRLQSFAASCALAALAAAGSASADDSVNTGYFGGVAIMGYDTVAYFTEGKAVKGSEEFSYEWLGTPWHFASKEHQEMFMSEPANTLLNMAATAPARSRSTDPSRSMSIRKRSRSSMASSI